MRDVPDREPPNEKQNMSVNVGQWNETKSNGLAWIDLLKHRNSGYPKYTSPRMFVRIDCTAAAALFSFAAPLPLAGSVCVPPSH